jgi:hypothetical protein
MTSLSRNVLQFVGEAEALTYRHVVRAQADSPKFGLVVPERDAGPRQTAPNLDTDPRQFGDEVADTWVR